MNKLEVEKKFWSQVNVVLDLILEVEATLDEVPAGKMDEKAVDDMSEGIYKLYKELEVKVAVIKAIDLHHEAWTASEFHNTFYNALSEITKSRAQMQSLIWKQVRLHKAYRAL